MEVESHEPVQDEAIGEEDGARQGMQRVELAKPRPCSCGSAPDSLSREQSTSLPPEPSVRERLQYLQALYPYGAHDDLMNVIMTSPDTRTAAKAAYEVLNPHIYGLPFLQEQYELRNNRKVPPSDRANAFSGITELLEERANDVLRPGHFESLSQMREYNRTVRTFAVDSSAWDAQFLSPERSFSVFSQQHLPLTSEELARLPTSKRPPRGPASAPGSAAAADSPHVRERRRTSRPTTARHLQSSSDGGDKDEPPVESGSSPHTHRTTSTSLSGVVTGFESFLDDHDAAPPLAAPMVRWAPKALRVGPAEAQQQQEDMLHVFDEATFFDVRLTSNAGTSVCTPLVPADAARSGKGLAADTTAANRSNTASPPFDPGATRKGRPENHAPDAATAAAATASHHSSGDLSVMSDVLVDSPKPPGVLRTSTGSGSPTTPPHQHESTSAFASITGKKVVSAAGAATPRTTAAQTLAERRKRHGPTAKLQDRLKGRTPLDYVFEHEAGEPSAAAAAAGQGGSSASVEAGRADASTARVWGTPCGAGGEAAEPDARGGPFSSTTAVAAPRAAAEPAADDADASQAEDPLVFLNQEEERLRTMERLLMRYNDIFDNRGRCYIVRQIAERCPLFVKGMADITRALLHVVSGELTGKKLADGLNEKPVDMPFFRDKLLSTSAFVVTALEFNLDKCEAALDPRDPSFVRATVKVTKLQLEPIHFVYIDQTDAARQNRAACDARKRRDRRRGTVALNDTTYERGYTRGTLQVEMKKVSLSVVGTAALLISGSMVTQVDRASLRIGSLRLSTDVKKLSFLLSVGKPIVKAALRSIIENAIVDQHSI